MIDVLNQVATAKGRRDEKPNIELARKIVAKHDVTATKLLVNNIHNKNKDISNDCIKVLYEIGEKKPEMISPFIDDFVGLLKHKNNRLQWGAMHALDTIADADIKSVYKNLSLIIDAADKGSVITRDHAVGILIKLMKEKKYKLDAFELLKEQLKKAPVNQLAMYAERASGVIDEKLVPDFIKILTKRLPELEKESQKRRIEKAMKKFKT